MLQLDDVDELRAVLRMPPDVYAWLLEKLRPHITFKTTNFRNPISAEERLAVTLRYLALGDGFRSLHGQFRIGLNMVGRIVKHTCRAIYRHLKDEFLTTPSTEEEWLKVEAGFRQTWNCPHVIGAIDGKHIRIVCPPSSGTFFFNYKHYYSLVLMAIVNASYEFIYMDIGAEGKASDGGVWSRSAFHQDLYSEDNPLNVPTARPIPGIAQDIPFFLVGDDAFSMTTRLMKPYPQLNLNRTQKIFNYRLSRCRRVVENAFGILSTKFRIFRREMEMRPEGCELVVAACVCLHNMMRRKCPKVYMAPRMVDGENTDHEEVEGLWRNEPELDNLSATHARNPRTAAKNLRERLATYFLQKEGEVHWQYGRI